MSDFLETLKSRLAEAQARLQVAAHRLQAAQVEHQAAAQSYASLQNVVQAETAREQSAAQARPIQASAPARLQQATPPEVPTPQLVPTQEATEVTKTDHVRRLLAQHGEGMAANDIWKHLSAQIGNKSYLYSILKRLRDKGDVYQRRHKYFLKVAQKEEGDTEHHVVLQ